MKTVIHNTPHFNCEYAESNVENAVLFGNHCHVAWEFLLVLDGFVSVTVENRTYRNLQKGSLMILPPYLYHSSFSAVPCRYRRMTVRFDESAIPKEIRQSLLEKIKNTPVVSLLPVSFLSENLLYIFTSQEQEKYTPLLESLLVQLFYYLLQTEQNKISSEQDERLESVIAYIDEHLQEKITLQQLSEHSFLSVSALCHLFQSQMKTSVKQYILQKKMAYAARLLQSGVSSTKAASTVGYQHYADFYAAYRKVTGETPSDSKRAKQ